MYVALALLVTGLTTLAGSDDLLAAFAAGTAFAWDDWFVLAPLLYCVVFILLIARVMMTGLPNRVS